MFIKLKYFIGNSFEGDLTYTDFYLLYNWTKSTKSLGYKN